MRDLSLPCARSENTQVLSRPASTVRNWKPPEKQWIVQILVILDAVFLVADFWDTSPHFSEQKDWFEITDNICDVRTDILSYLKFHEKNLKFCSTWFLYLICMSSCVLKKIRMQVLMLYNFTYCFQGVQLKTLNPVLWFYNIANAYCLIKVLCIVRSEIMAS